MNQTGCCTQLLGIILKHQCKRTKGVVACSRCQRLVCDKHIDSISLRCLNCIPRTHTDNFTDHDRSSGGHTSGHSGGVTATDWKGSGGEFSGGGAEGSWDNNSSSTNSDNSTAATAGAAMVPLAAAAASTEFSAEDFAAFDQITAPDQGEKANSYDS